MASKQSPVVVDDQPTGEARPGHRTAHEAEVSPPTRTEAAERMFGYWPNEMIGQ
jgi:hypothetical protein